MMPHASANMRSTKKRKADFPASAAKHKAPRVVVSRTAIS